MPTITINVIRVGNQDILAYSEEREVSDTRELSIALPSVLTDGIAGVVAKALAAGFEVTGVARIGQGWQNGVWPNRFLINGHPCVVSNPRMRSRTHKLHSKRWITYSSMSRRVLGSVEVAIIHTTVEGFPEHTFVIPSAVLLGAYFGPGQSVVKHICIPVERLPVYKNRTHRVDVWPYEDAWHLLAPKTRSPVP